MKKKSIIIASLFMLLICGYLTYNQLNPNCVSLDADRDYFQTVDELERTSDLIVEVQATNKVKTHYEIIQDSIPDYGWTNRDVIVNKVYKAPEGFSEQSLTIREAYWDYTNLIGQRIVMYVGDYRPMKPNKTYILFLVKNDDATYQPNYTDQGKYLINSKLQKTELFDEYIPDDFEIGAEVPNYSYKGFYKEVIKKYK